MTQPDPHSQPPPDQSPLVQQVAQILATAYATHLIAQMLVALFRPWRVSMEAAMAALVISGKGTNHAPRQMRGDARREQARQDLYFRAAYVVNASRRIQAMLDRGVGIKQAISTEHRNWRAHEQARRNRLAKAQAVDDAAAMFGPVLGWYLNPLLNNDPECIAADGHNFHAGQRPLIGWPGAVHPNCGCKAGPPIAGAGWVDEAVRPVLRRVRLASTTKYRLKRAS